MNCCDQISNYAMPSDCCNRFQNRKIPFLRNKDISEHELHTKQFQFQIRSITQLPLAEDNCATTETLKFNGIQWHIQIYNNGLKINGSEGWINFIVVRGGAHIPDKNVLLTFGILDREGVEQYTTEYTFQKYDLVTEPIKLLPVSEACSKEKKFLQNDYVEICCRMQLMEPVQEYIPFNALSEEIGRLVVKRPKTLAETISCEIPQPSSAMQAAGGSNMPDFIHNEEQIDGLHKRPKDLFTIKDVTWQLRSYEEMRPTLGYSAVSPEFKFFGETYRMRIYTLGWNAYASYRGIAVVLERSRSAVQKEVTCEFSSNYKSDRSETHCLEKHVDVLGPIKLVFHSETESFKHMPLEIFCHVMAKGLNSFMCDSFEPNSGEGRVCLYS